MNDIDKLGIQKRPIMMRADIPPEKLKEIEKDWMEQSKHSVLVKVDKVHMHDAEIAELQMKLAATQQVLRLNKPEALYSDLETMGRLKHETDVVARRERHHKYKRCLAMARWCDEVMMSCELRGYTVHRIWANRHQWAMRWKYRWLELAEKFKEG